MEDQWQWVEQQQFFALCSVSCPICGLKQRPRLTVGHTALGKQLATNER